MFIKNYDGIDAKNRGEFKQRLWDISMLFKINFVKDKATVIYQEPYNMEEIDIETKAKALSTLKSGTFIHDFRVYQIQNS